MEKVHPVSWFKKQPLPLKVALLALALILVGKIMQSRASTGAVGTSSGWDPRSYVAGGRWGGL